MISIIIPVLNEVAITSTALNRLLLQQGDYEVIVVDGGSTDGTRDVIRRLALPLVDWSPNQESSISAQINCGAQQAQGDVLVFLHVDVQLPDNAIALINDALIPPVVVGGGFVPKFSQLARPARQSNNIALTAVERLWQKRTRRLTWFAGDTAPFIRTKHFVAAGGYPNSSFASDWDWAWQLKTLGPLAVIRETVLVDPRRHLYNGVIKTLLVTGSVELMYHLGVNRIFLRNWYRKWLPRERQQSAEQQGYSELNTSGLNTNKQEGVQ